ncbi:Uncharacterised protein [Staphylococcus intermedius NCTC 11048]|uniref:Uncharacterized protein n=1 Tax=Staphylococcus intermedius NCTC 11048 TaxID=1141106 RepID=A0A380G724_STAIN|nr:Uncharacterised protein [Staphylococcus intermedius NCTC 11048]
MKLKKSIASIFLYSIQPLFLTALISLMSYKSTNGLRLKTFLCPNPFDIFVREYT